MKSRLLVAILLVSVLACSKKQPAFAVAHRYTLTGRIVSLNPKDQTASIAADAIPNYMEAMTMDYPVESRADFDKLRVDEHIKATLNVSAGNDEYDLTSIQVTDEKSTR